MNQRTKIKVDRRALLVALKAKRTEQQAAYVNDLAAYEKDKATYPKRVADYVADAAKRLKTGELTPGEISDSYRSKFFLGLPEKPDKPYEPTGLDLSIAQLEMGFEDFVLISGEDFARYLA